MEVKTVNESLGQKKYFETPREIRDFVPVEHTIQEGFKGELLRAIDSARRQLLACSAPATERRIIYLVVRPDFNFQADNELLEFVRSQNREDFGIVLHLL